MDLKTMNNLETFKILSSEVSFPSSRHLIKIFSKENLKKITRDYIIVTNAHNQLLAHINKNFLEIHKQSIYIFSDSSILEFAAKFLYKKRSKGVFLGSWLVREICRIVEKEDINIGFYGSSQINLKKLKLNLLNEFPDLNIKFTFSPPHMKNGLAQDEKSIKNMNNEDLDIVFIGLGCPKQEEWMYTNSKRINAVLIGVGAAFDFIATPENEIPKRIHNKGFGWLYRLIKTPKRLYKRYLIDGPKFILYLILQKLKGYIQ